MSNSDTPTYKRQDVPLALVIAGDETLLRAVAKAALTAQVLLAECTVADATNTAATMKPLVIVVPDRIYATDPQSYDDLARDVQAGLLRVADAGDDHTGLENKLIALMMDAESRRDH